MRQFAISPTTGRFEPRPVSLTPDLTLNGQSAIGDFVNENEAAILQDQHVVPAMFEGKPFATGSVINTLGPWTAPGIVNRDARYHFSLNTCSGCHGAETNVTFLQVLPRFAGQRAALSPFLAGTTAFDPVNLKSRKMNDLTRRRADLSSIVCRGVPGALLPKGENVLMEGPASTLEKGMGRVH